MQISVLLIYCSLCGLTCADSEATVSARITTKRLSVIREVTVLRPTNTITDEYRVNRDVDCWQILWWQATGGCQGTWGSHGHRNRKVDCERAHEFEGIVSFDNTPFWVDRTHQKKISQIEHLNKSDSIKEFCERSGSWWLEDVGIRLRMRPREHRELVQTWADNVFEQRVWALFPFRRETRRGRRRGCYVAFFT